MPPARRFFAILVALAQTGLGAGLAVADGRIEAEAVAAASSHVEAQGSTTCPRQHLADCAVCRALELQAGPQRGPSVSAAATAASVAVFARAQEPALSDAARLPDSRAPPGGAAGALRPGPG
jgi:hypothetical protein